MRGFRNKGGFRKGGFRNEVFLLYTYGTVSVAALPLYVAMNITNSLYHMRIRATIMHLCDTLHHLRLPSHPSQRT